MTRQEKLRGYSRKYRAKNVEKVRESDREFKRRWRQENPGLNAEQMREWRKNNPGRDAEIARQYRKRNSHSVLKQHLARCYGITVELYDALFRRQQGKCAICLEPPKKSRLCVDHCHSTGKIRGLLCRTCNVGIGLLQDSEVILRRATGYLEGNV